MPPGLGLCLLLRDTHFWQGVDVSLTWMDRISMPLNFFAVVVPNFGLLAERVFSPEVSRPKIFMTG